LKHKSIKKQKKEREHESKQKGNKKKTLKKATKGKRALRQLELKRKHRGKHERRLIRMSVRHQHLGVILVRKRGSHFPWNGGRAHVLFLFKTKKIKNKKSLDFQAMKELVN